MYAWKSEGNKTSVLFEEGGLAFFIMLCIWSLFHLTQHLPSYHVKWFFLWREQGIQNACFVFFFFFLLFCFNKDILIIYKHYRMRSKAWIRGDDHHAHATLLYIFYTHWSFIIPHQPRSESDKSSILRCAWCARSLFWESHNNNNS